MSTTADSATGARSDRERVPVRQNTARRLTTETKAAFKTTEFVAWVAATIGVLIATAVVDEANGGGLGAKQGWLYVTILTVGYMVSRGLAKSGSSQPYDENNS
jgi:hypothetical protein